MIISRNWLQEYFDSSKDGKLPSTKELAEILTMHSFEIESVETLPAGGQEKSGDDIIDIKVLPNRAHDCLCHRGIAREIATLLGKNFVDREISETKETEDDSGLKVEIQDSKLCPRYIGRRVENISVKDSPKWLSEKLETLGERSINNVVDITNFIMLDFGQPMHAFDADKVAGGIRVRLAAKDEKIELLDGKEAMLDESILLITDEKGPLAIAGVKGGKRAEVTAETKNIILESANFNPSMVRKTSQKLGIKNNSSKRYENEISPELAGLAMRYATKLISENASTDSTKIYKTEDIYPRRRNSYKVGVSLSEINRHLGTKLTEKEVENILNKTGWKWEKVNPIEKVKTSAETLIGKPYLLGASVSYDAPEKFDCSSFAAYVFAQAGISLPRMSVDQYVYSERIKKEELSSGDLVFINGGNGKIHYKSIEWLAGSDVPEGVDHVGIFLGEDKIIHTSKTTGAVFIEKLSESKYFAKPVGFGRIKALKEERFVITAPFERLDLKIKVDLVEEIGRIYGYENIASASPKEISTSPEINEDFALIQQIRSSLINLGYSEVYNYAFSEKGEVEVENPIASDKPFLRSNLKDSLVKSLELNWRNAPLLALEEVKIFEIGTVFYKDKEQINAAWGIKNKKEVKVEEYEMFAAQEKLTNSKAGNRESIPYFPRKADAKFEPFSSYPFILRDIAVWTPKNTKEAEVLDIIVEKAGKFLVQKRLFDKFEKNEKVSYAFNLVFQSQERTLTDSEINEVMEKITAALNSKNDWQVR